MGPGSGTYAIRADPEDDEIREGGEADIDVAGEAQRDRGEGCGRGLSGGGELGGMGDATARRRLSGALPMENTADD